MRISLPAASAALAVVTALLLPAAPPAAAAPRPSGCPTAAGRVVCVSLGRQQLWLARDGKRVWGPAPIRSGRPAFPTRTGWHRITRRVEDDHSRLYDAPMPYAQYFDGGQALHGVYGYVHTGQGSHGCVNLLHEDAGQLWRRTRVGDRVYVWGTRPARLK